MKKLVAIALIAAMATVANAGLAMVVSGVDKDLVAPGLQVDAGDTVKISLTAPASFNGFNIDALDDGLAGDQRGSADSIGGVHAGLTYGLPGYIENSPTCLVSYFAAFATGNSVSGLVMNFDYTVAALKTPGMITIAALPEGTSFYSNVDGAWYVATPATCDIAAVTTAIDGVSFDVIPEPMTLGLLGLGGLFLRRRLA